MNLSPSRFKTLLQNKSITTKHRVALFISATLVLVAISCQLRNSVDDPVSSSSSSAAISDEKSVAVEAKENTSAAIRSLFTAKPKFLTLYYKKDTAVIPAVEVQDTWCSADNSSGRAHLRLTLVSPVGNFPLDIEVNPTAPGKYSAKFQIDGRTFDLADFQPLSPAVKDALCSPSSNGAPMIAASPSQVVLGDDDVKAVRSWLRSAGPDCAFTTPVSEGWECHLPVADPLAAEIALNSISKTLVEKWNRQPYLFTRRLMIATTLSRSLMATNQKPALDRFCRVLELSLPQEVPLAFDSNRWRKTVCTGASPRRAEVAAIGLAKAHSELAFLKLLIERTSTLGTLTIRVPREHAPDGELLVNLSPAKEVTDALVAESARIWSKEGVLAKHTGNEDGEAAESNTAAHQPLPMACWHPLFGESTELVKLAKYLSLSGNGVGLNCGPEATAPANATATNNFMVPERYIAESIASETEFTIINGRSKVLRLPQGAYTYVIYGAADASEDGEIPTDNKNKTSGSITWSKKTPRPLINSWQ